MLISVHPIENAKAVAWSESQFPARSHFDWPLKLFPISSRPVRLKFQLFLDLRLDQSMMFRFDCAQMRVDLRIVDQDVWLRLCHVHYREPGDTVWRRQPIATIPIALVASIPPAAAVLSNQYQRTLSMAANSMARSSTVSPGVGAKLVYI